MAHIWKEGHVCGMDKKGLILSNSAQLEEEAP